MLLKKLRAEIISCIEVIDSSYKELTHIELISHCAELHEKFEMYKVFMNATPNKKNGFGMFGRDIKKLSR